MSSRLIDRVIQQAILQRLQPLWDPTFSEHAYGFRPGRSAHQAVAQAQAHVIEGHRFAAQTTTGSTSGEAERKRHSGGAKGVCTV